MQHRFLALEKIEHRAALHAGGSRDITGAGAVKAFEPELPAGGQNQLVATVALIALLRTLRRPASASSLRCCYVFAFLHEASLAAFFIFTKQLISENKKGIHQLDKPLERRLQGTPETPFMRFQKGK
ncbi:MAG: hypothetical protein RR473_13085 [Comamonas sp.]